tara:strand:- start:4361 stop:5119 length:759 start_codon:yes stop_codon:yes gene_type:complete
MTAGPRESQNIILITTQAGVNLKFDVGDKVIYPNHGIGIIREISTKTILDTTCGFYSLGMISTDTTVLVPIDNVESVGLRKAIEEEEIKKIYTLLGNGKIEDHQNWKGRFKDNSDKMRTGSIYDVVDVLKSLNYLSQSKNLSFREKRMLDRAKFLVVTEVSEVSDELVDAVDEKVNKALERCLVNRVRQVERLKAKAAKAKSKTAKSKKKVAKTKTVKAGSGTVKGKPKTVKAKVKKSSARSTAARRATRAS